MDDHCFEFEVLRIDNDTLQIRISGTNGGFKGTAEVYVPAGGLAEAAGMLEGFPAKPADERELVFGIVGTDWTDGGVKFRFYCEGLCGQGFVEAWFESRYRSSQIVESAHLYAPVEAHGVDTFVAELRRMEREHSGIAHLVLAIPMFGNRLMNSDTR